MPGLIARLVAWLGSFFTGWAARFLGVGVIRFTAYKAIFSFLVMTALPLVIYNVISLLIGEMMEVSRGLSGGLGATAVVAQFTGIAGYIGIKLKLPETFAIILSAMTIRMAMNLVPFVGKM
jgi:hypothetical protein